MRLDPKSTVPPMTPETATQLLESAAHRHAVTLAGRSVGVEGWWPADFCLSQGRGQPAVIRSSHCVPESAGGPAPQYTDLSPQEEEALLLLLCDANPAPVAAAVRAAMERLTSETGEYWRPVCLRRTTLVLFGAGVVSLPATSVQHMGAQPGDLLVATEPEPGVIQIETDAHHWAARGAPKEEGSWPAQDNSARRAQLEAEIDAYRATLRR